MTDTAMVGLCIATACLAFFTGFLSRVSVHKKQKKNILKLKNEMLVNKERILWLEGKIADVKVRV